MSSVSETKAKVALITGASHRIGATTARTLHGAGLNIVIHYNRSKEAAQRLKDELEAIRPNSAAIVAGNLLDSEAPAKIIEEAAAPWGRLDVLLNNASTFYPTLIGESTLENWDDLMGTNLKAPFFLSQAAAPYLIQRRGCIINIVDIHADRPLKSCSIYSMAKAGLVMMTKSLARELGPHVRVNAIAPGAIIWPENDMDDEVKQCIIDRTFLKRQGTPEDIAKAALFFIRDAAYVSGQILAIDGGRSLNS